MDAKNKSLESPSLEKSQDESKESVWKYLVGVNTKCDVEAEKNKKIDIDFFLELTPEKLLKISEETLIFDITEDETKKYECTSTLRELSKDLFMIKIRLKSQGDLIPCLYETPMQLTREDMINYLNSVSMDEIRKAQITL